MCRVGERPVLWEVDVGSKSFFEEIAEYESARNLSKALDVPINIDISAEKFLVNVSAESRTKELNSVHDLYMFLEGMKAEADRDPETGHMRQDV